MNSDHLHALHSARPFRPFVIHVADGRDLPVNHPEFLAAAPDGNIALVLKTGNGFEIVNLSLVTGLEVVGAEF